MNQDKELPKFWDEWRGAKDGDFKTATMYIKRLLKIATKKGNWRVDLHKMVALDPIGCFHSHPATAWRIPLWGGYEEEIITYPDPEHAPALYYTSVKEWRPGMIGKVLPAFAHRISFILNRRCSYSLWIRGPITDDIKLLGEGWPKEAKPNAGAGKA